MESIRWITRLAAIALIALSPALCPAAAAAGKAAKDAPAKKPVTFKVASYNINYGNPNLGEVYKAVVKADADVVCFQETNRSSEAYLRRQFWRKYHYYKFIRAPHHAAGGYGFLSKVPLKNVTFIPRHKGMFGTYVAEVKLGDKDIQIASLHLQPMFFSNGTSLTAAWSKLKEYEQIHAAEIVHIHGKLSKTLPLIVLGDLNSMSMLYAPRYLKGKGFVDSFASVTPEADSHITWRWRTGKMLWKYRLDYILHSAHFRTLSSTVVQSEGSDHFLVTSSLTWAPPKATTRPAEDAKAPQPKK